MDPTIPTAHRPQAAPSRPASRPRSGSGPATGRPLRQRDLVLLSLVRCPSPLEEDGLRPGKRADAADRS